MDKTYTQIELTEFQRENLQKLSDYLLSGKLKAAFDMKCHHDDYSEWESIECGTVGCAVRHGPYAGIKKRNNESWYKYARRCFVCNFDCWQWCFCSEWSKIDNSAIGAAKRIQVLLNKGLPNIKINRLGEISKLNVGYYKK
jgi:hypothetical protein